MDDSFTLFLLVGFLAQIVDGALGMAYGVVSSSVLYESPVATGASLTELTVIVTVAVAVPPFPSEIV